MWLLLLVCAKQPPQTAAPPQDTDGTVNDSALESDTSSGDTSTDTSIDTSSDTGDVSVTFWESPGPCGEWSGVQTSTTTWNYVASDEYVESFQMDGGYTSTATIHGDGTVSIRSVGQYKGDSTSFSFDRTDLWRCDIEGAWLMRTDNTSTVVAGASTSTISGWRSFSPGWLVRPVQAEVSSSWVDGFDLESEINGSHSGPDAIQCVSTVDEESVFSLDGGDFVARKVFVDCDELTDTYRWLSRYIGLVQTNDELLDGYRPE